MTSLCKIGLVWAMIGFGWLPAVQASAEAEVGTARKPGILVALFGTDEERALRRQERVQRQDEAGLVRLSSHGGENKARMRVREAVERAVANRPKGRLWCVPFARSVSGINLRGNAKTWWAQAEGLYERGSQPVIGAVMNFAASRAMPKGHVAVVSDILSEREILIDHANWERNRISTAVLVVDVSKKGDWSQVRVANSAGTLGRVNPVYGFIYN